MESSVWTTERTKKIDPRLDGPSSDGGSDVQAGHGRKGNTHGRPRGNVRVDWMCHPEGTRARPESWSDITSGCPARVFWEEDRYISYWFCFARDP